MKTLYTNITGLFIGQSTPSPLTGEQLGSAFGLGDVIQSQSTNTSLTVEAINSLKQEFRRRILDLAAVIEKVS